MGTLIETTRDEMRVLLALVCVFAVASAGWWPCDKELNKEYPPAGEDEALAKMSKIVLDRQKGQKAAGGDALRFFHAKAHAGLRGVLTVADDVPAQYRWGIFSTPGKNYDVFARFSNGLGSISPDSGLDTRGAAIKVLGCSGLRLREGETAAEKQECDFIMAAYSRFFFPDAASVAEGMEVLSADGISGAIKKGLFFLTHPRSAAAILGMGIAGKVPSPFATPYWSQTPYALGSQSTVKFQLKPCSAYTGPQPNRDDANFLRDAIQQQLNVEGRAACFDWYVQRQEDACDQPIEDSLVEWSTAFTRLGRLVIPPNQDINSDKARLQTQSLSFNPWRNVQAHRPLGINRVRKDIYVTSSDNRHKLNGNAVYHPAASQLTKSEL